LDAATSGVPAQDARNAAAAISSRLPLLSPEQDVALQREAGFGDVELFYAAFTFKGWIAGNPSWPCMANRPADHMSCVCSCWWRLTGAWKPARRSAPA
jgi:hypothetical protein